MRNIEKDFNFNPCRREENVLVSLITRFAASRHPLSHTQVQEMMEEITLVE